MGIAEKGRPEKGAPGRRFWNGEDGSLSRGMVVQGGGQQDHARSQEPDWTRHMPPGREKAGSSVPQGQGVLGEEPAVPQGEQLGKGEELEQEGQGHPQVDEPGAQAAQQPAAAQGKDQSWYQGYGGGKEQTAPAVPPKHAGIKRQRTAAGRRGTGGRCRSVLPPSRARAYCQGRTGVAAVRTAARRSAPEVKKVRKNSTPIHSRGAGG